MDRREGFHLTVNARGDERWDGPRAKEGTKDAKPVHLEVLRSESNRKTCKLGRALRVLEMAKGINLNVSRLKTRQRHNVWANFATFPKVLNSTSQR